MVMAFVVLALSFPKLNNASPIRKLILLSITFLKVIEKIRNFFASQKFFFTRGLFSSPNSKKCLFFPPPLQGGGKWPEYTPLPFCSLFILDVVT
jgi:hypothetical protein